MNDISEIIQGLKGILFDATPAEQAEYRKCADELKAVIASHKDMGLIAAAIIGLESMKEMAGE